MLSENTDRTTISKLTEFLKSKSKPFLITVNILLLIFVGLVDYVTGYEIGVSLFYLIPISFGAWFGGRIPSIILSFLSVLTIIATDFLAGKEYPHLFIEIWSLLMHLGFFVVYAVVLSLVKADMDKHMRLVEELQKALGEVKQLSGILHICASCKKIRDDEGYWKQIEPYITSHSEAQFSHGICPECLKKLYPELSESVSGKDVEKIETR